MFEGHSTLCPLLALPVWFWSVHWCEWAVGQSLYVPKHKHIYSMTLEPSQLCPRHWLSILWHFVSAACRPWRQAGTCRVGDTRLVGHGWYCRFDTQIVTLKNRPVKCCFFFCLLMWFIRTSTKRTEHWTTLKFLSVKACYCVPVVKIPLKPFCCVPPSPWHSWDIFTCPEPLTLTQSVG